MCDTWFTHSKARGRWAEAALALRSQPQRAIWEGLHFVPADLTKRPEWETHTRKGDPDTVRLSPEVPFVL